MENPTQVNESLFSKHLKTWGLTIDPTQEFYSISERHESNAIQQYIRHALNDMRNNGTLPCYEFYQYYYRLFNCFQPAQAKDNPLNLAVYESKDKFDRDIRLSGKPGKIIKRILPFASESFCAAFADWFKEQFTDIAYTVKESTDSECFALAYSGIQSKTTNPNLSFNNEFKLYAKSLSGSCMRHDKSDFRSGLPIHPAEVYASGDFKIVYAVDSKGHIGARCVVNIKQRDTSVYKPGPIYTATDSAFNALAAYMVAQGYDKQGTCESSGWSGARIRAVEFDGGYIAPFMDLCGEGNLTGDDEFFRLSRNGDFTFRETGGTIESEQFCCSCADCGEGIREDDDHFYIENSGENVCQSCFDSSYFQCAGSGDTYSNDDGVEVYYRSYGRTRSRTYSQDYVDSGRGDCVFCDNSDEYWNDSDVVYIECEEIYVPAHNVTEDYFLSDVDSEYYPLSDMVKIDCLNECWTLEQVTDSDQFDVVTNEGGETTVTLKCHLEVNDSGLIVDNQLTLPLAA
jgi:hypothetical protein